LSQVLSGSRSLRAAAQPVFLAAAAGVVTDLRRYRGSRTKRTTCGVAKVRREVLNEVTVIFYG
jgi:hypothetical protein